MRILTTQWNKLVRDRIPEIIRESGGIERSRILELDEYGHALIRKLEEETMELARATQSEIAEEAADVLEVLEAFCRLHGVDISEVMSAKAAKLKQRGGFGARCLLLETDP